MDKQYLFTYFLDLPESAKSIFKDIINAFIRQSGSKNALKCTSKKGNLIEGNDIVILVYKNDLICSEETKKHFNISDKFHLGTISFMRMEIVENLEKSKLIQKLHIRDNSEDLDEEILDEDIKRFVELDESTGKYKFKSALSFDSNGITLGSEKMLFDELSESEKKLLEFYKKYISAYGENDITDILNLDESYFLHDYFLTDLDNLLHLLELIKDENLKKPIIQEFSIEKNILLINGKDFRIQSKKKRYVKSIEFFDLLLKFFSVSSFDSVTLTQLVEFLEEKKIKYSQLQAGDVGNTRRVNSYIGGIKDNLSEIYAGDSAIFTKQSNVINLKKGRIVK